MQIELVTPAERHRETFLRGLRELQHEGLPWYLGADVADVEHDFPAYVARKCAEANCRSELLVPKTLLWAIAGEQFVGRIAIHHALNDALRLEGGHIGYDTVPSFRGRGVATEMPPRDGGGASGGPEHPLHRALGPTPWRRAPRAAFPRGNGPPSCAAPSTWTSRAAAGAQDA